MAANGQQRNRHSEERGVTTAEYALLVALIGLVAIISLSSLRDAAASRFESASAGVAVENSGPNSPDGSGSVGGGSTTTTAAPTTTTTTTTTMPPTTTTTTTTMPPTTTTTMPPTTAYSSFGAPVTSTSGSNWKAEVAVNVTDDNARAVSGATVVVRVDNHNGTTWTAGPEITGTTADSGSLLFDSGLYPRTGKDAVAELRFTIVTVNHPVLVWSGAGGSVSVPRV
jgi:Flp pilus assembly pilin Flp